MAIHRDDLPPELIKKLEDRFPGMKIHCVGDAPEGSLPPDLIDAMESLQAHFDRSLCEGRCTDCDAEMPGFPKKESDWDGFQPDKGWCLLRDLTDDSPKAWVCPECDDA